MTMAEDPKKMAEGKFFTEEGTPVDKFLRRHSELLDRIKDITAKKNHDYTAGDADPFANFMAVESYGITDAEVGMLTRMTDKWMRVIGMVKNGANNRKVKSESFEDTCLDMANYMILLAMLHEHRVKANQEIFDDVDEVK